MDAYTSTHLHENTHTCCDTNSHTDLDMYIYMKIYPHTTDNVIRLGLEHGYQDKVYYIEHAAMPRTGKCDVL